MALKKVLEIVNYKDGRPCLAAGGRPPSPLGAPVTPSAPRSTRGQTSGLFAAVLLRYFFTLLRDFLPLKLTNCILICFDMLCYGLAVSQTTFLYVSRKLTMKINEGQKWRDVYFLGGSRLTCHLFFPAILSPFFRL